MKAVNSAAKGIFFEKSPIAMLSAPPSIAQKELSNGTAWVVLYLEVPFVWKEERKVVYERRAKGAFFFHHRMTEYVWVCVRVYWVQERRSHAAVIDLTWQLVRAIRAHIIQHTRALIAFIMCLISNATSFCWMHGLLKLFTFLQRIFSAQSERFHCRMHSNRETDINLENLHFFNVCFDIWCFADAMRNVKLSPQRNWFRKGLINR